MVSYNTVSKDKGIITILLNYLEQTFLKIRGGSSYSTSPCEHSVTFGNMLSFFVL